MERFLNVREILSLHVWTNKETDKSKLSEETQGNFIEECFTFRTILKVD